MAGDEVDLPAIGKTKKQWVWVGLAAAGGYVAYAWWKNRGASSSTQPVLDPNDVVPASDYVNPSPGGSSPVSVDSTGDTITTNAEWTQKATAYLLGIGWDAHTVSLALGKYLNREELTAQEIEAVQAATGAFGFPPEGGPYPIKPVSTGDGGGTTTPPPTNTAAPGALTGVGATVEHGSTNLHFTLGSGTTTSILIEATPTDKKYGGTVDTTIPTAGMKAGQATGHSFNVDSVTYGATYKYVLTPYNGSAHGPSSTITVTNAK